jgi:hypothetical protein
MGTVNKELIDNKTMSLYLELIEEMKINQNTNSKQ